MNDDINKSIFQLIILFAKHFYYTVNIVTKIIHVTALGSHSDSTTDPRGEGGRDSGAQRSLSIQIKNASVLRTIYYIKLK